MSYPAERFEAAVSALVGEGSVKNRLIAAYAEHLDDLENSALPQGLRTKFEHLPDEPNFRANRPGTIRIRPAIAKLDPCSIAGSASTPNQRSHHGASQ